MVPPVTPASPVRVAVVVVTYQSEREIGDCLVSLRGAADGVEVASVVVVDNASTDGTLARASAAMPEALIVADEQNRGYAAAINVGRSRSAPHDALLVLNPDTVAMPGLLSGLAKAAMGPPQGLAVPRITDADGNLSLSLRRYPTVGSAVAEAVLGGRRAGRWGVGEIVADPRRYEVEHAVDWATGAAVMMSWDSWDRLGGWDESFFLYSEETELMARASAMGIRVLFVPDAVCHHVGGASGHGPDLWSLLITNKVRLFSRTHGALSSAAFRAAVFAGQAVRGVAGDAGSRRAAASLLRPRPRGGPQPRGLSS